MYVDRVKNEYRLPLVPKESLLSFIYFALLCLSNKRKEHYYKLLIRCFTIIFDLDICVLMAWRKKLTLIKYTFLFKHYVDTVFHNIFFHRKSCS